MIKFILNNNNISADVPSGMLLLDYVRYTKNLVGTKIGCREGDCGACTVLIGDLKNNEVDYRSFTSCLTPMGNVHGKHVLTIEGINGPGLNPIQQAMSDCSATQCGFCTPGFVMSLAGFCLSKKEPTQQNAIASIDGNICRCTGYKSIERAAAQVTAILKEKGETDSINFVVSNKILPKYLLQIKEKLAALSLQLNGELKQNSSDAIVVGGGTDLYVQKHDEMKWADIHFMFPQSELKQIKQDGNRCILGASVTVTDMQESDIFRRYFPNFNKQVQLISSTPIRNVATIGGNLINASPIGDFTIFFLALNATVLFSNGKNQRELPLRKLYKGYKLLDKNPGEYIQQIYFTLPDANTLFNFEKVSKRTHLDIASVNSAMAITTVNGHIIKASISAGGVGPIPMFLESASKFLEGKLLSEDLINEAIEKAKAEILPISDARGTAAYKTLLLGQLIKAHFITLFDSLDVSKVIRKQS